MSQSRIVQQPSEQELRDAVAHLRRQQLEKCQQYIREIERFTYLISSEADDEKMADAKQMKGLAIGLRRRLDMWRID